MIIPELRVVFWELTTICNLNCRHCRAEAGEIGGDCELSTALLLDIAESIRKVGDPLLILTGGEPLMRDDFFTIVRKCTSIFSRVALASNGTCIDGSMAQLLVDSGIQRVSISLDGADEQSHDHFRGQKGSYSAALEGCKALRENGMSLQINTTVTRHNITQLEQMVNTALLLGADAFHLFVLVPVGCGIEIPCSERLSAEEIETYLQQLYRLSRELAGKLYIKATCAPQYYRVLYEEGGISGILQHGRGRHGINSVTSGCLAGSSVCFVSHKGDVQPCGYLPIAAGNLLHTSFEELWQQSELFKRLRDSSQLKGYCGSCKHKIRCQGCRARAYASTGDYMAADPDCIFKENISSEM